MLANCWQKVSENRDKFYLSNTVYNMLFVIQHELANITLMCEGRLRLVCPIHGLKENEIATNTRKNLLKSKFFEECCEIITC